VDASKYQLKLSFQDTRPVPRTVHGSARGVMNGILISSARPPENDILLIEAWPPAVVQDWV
jgi:hypothetical protein